MRAAYDEVMTTGIKRRHQPPRIVGDLLERRDRRKAGALDQISADHRQAAAGQVIQDFDFTGTPVNEALIRDLATGAFLAEQRNAVLIGGTGTGKSHLAIAGYARTVLFFSTIPSSISSIGWRAKPAPAGRGDLPNTSRAWTSSFSTNSAICRLLRPVASCSFILISRLYERTSVIITTNLSLLLADVRRREDDDRAPRSSDTSL